jgi:hypothetical protein
MALSAGRMQDIRALPIAWLSVCPQLFLPLAEGSYRAGEDGVSEFKVMFIFDFSTNFV